MLQSSSFAAALPLAGKLASMGIAIAPKPNTILNQLVTLSVPSVNDNTPPAADIAQSAEQMNVYGQYLEAITNGTIELPSQHDLELGGIITDLSKFVNTHVSHAKNVVKPIVIQFAESIQEYKQNNVPKEASSQCNIVSLSIPILLKDESFLDSINAYDNKTILTPDLSFSLDPKTKEELVQFILIGHDRTDKLIVEWLSTMPDSFLNQIWISFFTNLNGADSIYSYSNVEAMNVYEKSNFALAIYLFARKLFDDVQSAKEMNLAQYQNTAAQIRDYAGSVLAANVKKAALYNKTKMLVVELFPNTYTAKVNGDVYKEWLASGGSPDIILGMIISGTMISSTVLIDEKAETLKDQWNSFITYYKTTEGNRSFSYLKEFLLNDFNRLLVNVTEAEKDFIEKTPTFVENVQKLVTEELNNLKTSDCDDCYQIALVLVGKCRFYYTSAYEILADINEASKVNPNVEVREAALLAVINYMADYMANQIGIVRNA